MHRYDVARISGPIIKKLRKQKHLTQKELGFLLNVSRNAVTNWECGTRMPSADQYHELSKIFDVPINHLLGTQEITPPEPKYTENSLDLDVLNDLGRKLLFDFYIMLVDNQIYTQNLTIIRHGRKKGYKNYVLYKKQLQPEMPEEVDPRDIILSQLEDDEI